MTTAPKSVRMYIKPGGGCPLAEWLADLDRAVRARLFKRLLRVSRGNLGACRSVGAGVSELKDTTGPGYRIYFGQQGDEIIILLCGGDKSDQSSDIKRAQAFWLDYLADPDPGLLPGVR